MWQPYDDGLLSDDPDSGDIVWWTRFGFLLDSELAVLQFPYEVQLEYYRLDDVLYLVRR